MKYQRIINTFNVLSVLCCLSSAAVVWSNLQPLGYLLLFVGILLGAVNMFLMHIEHRRHMLELIETTDRLRKRLQELGDPDSKKPPSG